MKEKKNRLRAEVKSVLRAEIQATKHLPCDHIMERIERLPEFAAARTVALFCSLPDEVSTVGMMRRWHGVKLVALPVVQADGEMVFREYTDEGSLGRGAFGIAEPREGREIPAGEIDLMIVPGVAFDRAGRRLGRGKGFYDRYLSRPDAAHIYKVGICAPHALVEEVPAEPHDVVMDKIVTNG